MQRRSESEPAMPDPATRSRVCTVQSAGSSAAAQDLVSGFVRFQSQLAIAARHECQTSERRLPTDRSSVRFGRGAKPRQGLLKPKAEGRVGRLGGMRQEPMRALLGARSYKTRTNLQHRFFSSFQSFGALYFPHDHSQGHPETRVGRLVTKIGRVARVRWRARGRIVVARDSARTHF